jgi:Spy/CpxP family protein refolding chaperone
MGTTGTTHSGLQFGPEGRWWDDKSVERSIGLRKDQKQRMDKIFDANKPAILASYKAFLGEQSKLDALNKDSQVDKTRLFAAIDAVSQARAALQKANSQMLLDIRKELDPDQMDKLEKLQ